MLDGVLEPHAVICMLPLASSIRNFKVPTPRVKWRSQHIARQPLIWLGRIILQASSLCNTSCQACVVLATLTDIAIFVSGRTPQKAVKDGSRPDQKRVPVPHELPRQAAPKRSPAASAQPSAGQQQDGLLASKEISEHEPRDKSAKLSSRITSDQPVSVSSKARPRQAGAQATVPSKAKQGASSTSREAAEGSRKPSRQLEPVEGKANANKPDKAQKTSPKQPTLLLGKAVAAKPEGRPSQLSKPAAGEKEQPKQPSPRKAASTSPAEFLPVAESADKLRVCSLKPKQEEVITKGAAPIPNGRAASSSQPAKGETLPPPPPKPSSSRAPALPGQETLPGPPAPSGQFSDHSTQS